jgi:hypothetical protein
MSASGLVRQEAQPLQSNVAGPQPLAYYCPAGNTDLFQPALSPDGQTIVAQALTTPNTGSNPSLPSGQPRLVTFPVSAAASGATPTPLTFLTPDGLGAGRPDFSPDGTQVAFSGPDGVYVMPAGGGTPQRVLTDASNPAWSPYTLPSQGPGPGPGPGPGGAKCHVPNVRGESVGGARTALRRANCALGSTKKAYSRHVKRGHVISQSHKPGTTLAAGAKVNVVVSKGKLSHHHR